MKKTLILCFVLLLGLYGCGKKDDVSRIGKDSPAFLLAQELAAVLPALDPAKAVSLVVSRNFKITTVEVIQFLQASLGNRIQELKALDALQLKDVVERSAIQIAERKLLLNAAQDANTGVSPEELNEALSYQYSRAGGEEAFQKALSENGLDLEEFKENIRIDLVIQNYLGVLLAQEMTVTDEEVFAVYEQDKTASARHILFLTEGKAASEKADILKKMEDLLARARGGEDFSSLAKEYTEDPGSKESGGLYENFGRGYMVKAFEDAAFSVPIGEISDVVETEYGYHIIQVLSREKETRPLDEVRAEIEEKIKQDKKSGTFEKHLMDLKQKNGFDIIAL
ncbi:MAG: peptidylprolyl isomerase [Candidatus Aminicenantes bacterium]|nr:peptidylprolyl isomerase [Candidatus Aminicenantes bacterium]